MLCLHLQLLPAPQGLSLTPVPYPWHPSRSIPNTNALALRASSKSQFSHPGAAALVHLQGQSSGCPEWLSGIPCTAPESFSPMLQLCTKLMALHTEGPRPEVKPADEILTNTTQIHSASCQKPLMYSSLIFLNNCMPSHPTLLDFSLF